MKRIIFGCAILATSIAMALPKQPAPKPPPAPIVPPQVTLALEATYADAGWKMQIKNTGQVPLRIVADARLLSFEIRGEAGAPVKCALPADAKPTSDIERALLLPPGRSYTETFDPRLYCFATKETNALVEGATVVAKYGFAASKTMTPPFIVSPPDLDPASVKDADVPWPSPVKEIESGELVLPKALPQAQKTAPAEGTPRLKVSMTQRTDTTEAFDQTVIVTVHNEGIRPETLLLVPSTVALDVQTPQGRAIRCSLGIAPAPLRDLLTTIGPNKDAVISIAADRVCPAGTFDYEGLYRVVPILDTRRVGPSPQTLAIGEWRGDPAIVRVRRGKSVRGRPELDPSDAPAKK